MQRETMIDWLQSLDPAGRLPLWVISYNRQDGRAPFLVRANQWETAGTVNVLVRASQQSDYMRSYPNLNIVSLPDEEIDNVGKTRWAAVELAGQETDGPVLLWDDDILSLRFLFGREFIRGPNKGKECSGHSTLQDLKVMPDLEEQCVAGISEIVRDAFEAEKDLVYGSTIRQHMSFSEKNHQTKYLVNGGASPHCTLIFHPARLAQKGIALDLDLFGIHGDDVGMTAEVLAAGAEICIITSFVWDVWAEDENILASVVRSPDNKWDMHEWEWDALQQYPIKDYLRIKRSILDGSFEWGDVNWAAYHKRQGTETRRVLWDEEAMAGKLLL